MNVGIIDADLMGNGTRHPNLALMKIAGYHSSKGDNVELIYNSYDEIKHYDKVYISKVFKFTNVPEWVLSEERVEYGGTGFFEDGGKSLPEEIEHHMPYYELYKPFIKHMRELGHSPVKYRDYEEYSIGFTTRGCFRRCDFCVNKKYKKVQRHAKVEEFLSQERPKIYLWDDNILAYSKWEEVIDELQATGKRFQFRQGLDLRLMTDRKAEKLNAVRYYGDFIFAFDHLKDKEIIIKKIQVWKRYTNKYPKLYVLCAFESQDQVDIGGVFERIKILMNYGCIPYIMRYEAYNDSLYRGMYIQIARWCNQPQFYKKMSFREFCERNQYYQVDKSKMCSAYRAMIEFESQHPKIAKKYFDLKLVNENIYTTNYGFGRRYCNKQDCNKCKLESKAWENLVTKKIDVEDIIGLYYSKQIDTYCLEYKNSACNISSKLAANYIYKELIKVERRSIERIIKLHTDLEPLNKDNALIPKNYFEWYMSLLENMFLNNQLEIYDLKDFLSEISKNRDDDVKITKEDIKLLCMLDFLILGRENKRVNFRLSHLGSILLNKDFSKRRLMYERAVYRLPVIQQYIRRKESGEKFSEYLKSIGINNIKEIIYSINTYIKVERNNN